MTIRMFVIACVVAGLSAVSIGCAPGTQSVYAPVAHHTLKSGPDTDSDVVWVQIVDPNKKTTKLLRCTNTQGGPRCDAVQAP